MSQPDGQTAPKMPEMITATGFVDVFKQIHAIMPDRRFAFILGAGASKSSGIKLAHEMVAEWTTTLYRQSTSYPHVPESTWATAENLNVPGFAPKAPAASYPAFYRRMFAADPEFGYAYLEDQMAKAEPSYGYSVLGRILAKERHRVVVTVNFDNLVADSLSIFSTTYPLVCGHEALAQFANVDPRRPLVLKVHRDLLLHPMSDPADLAQPDPAFAEAVSKLLQRYTPIVIGYGGNDDSLMQCLETIPAKKIPGGVYWCYREKDAIPSQRILDFIVKHDGKLVPIIGFDELMLLLGDSLGIGNPDQDVLDRAGERAKRLASQFKRLKANSEQVASKQLSVAPQPNAHNSPADEQAPDTPAGEAKKADTLALSARTSEIEAVINAMDKLSGQTPSGKRWWQWQREATSEVDTVKRDAIYRAALAALPGSHELECNYANFLMHEGKEYDYAEELYKRAIEAAPGYAIYRNNYALFLSNVRKDHEGAEKLFKSAIETDPTDLDYLVNYANFKAVVLKDTDAAEALYLRAIEGDPDNADYLGNYTRLLLMQGRVDEGRSRLDEALLTIDSDSPDALRGELWMYAYCCRPESAHTEALKNLKQLVTCTKIRTGDWDFSGVIAQAVKMNHPASAWLPKLAEVLSGRADESTLAEWDDWQKAS